LATLARIFRSRLLFADWRAADEDPLAKERGFSSLFIIIIIIIIILLSLKPRETPESPFVIAGRSEK